MALSTDTSGDPDLIESVQDYFGDVGLLASRSFRSASVALVDLDEPNSFRFANFGVTERTPFEAAGLSQVFLGHLFADTAARGIVTVNTPVGDILDIAGDLASVQLWQLATQRGGLPQHPLGSEDFALAWQQLSTGANVYAGFDLDDLIRHAEENFVVGNVDTFTSSNIGSALLGQALAAAADLPYKQLLEERIFKRCRMFDSFVAVESGDLPSDVIQGFRTSGVEAAPRIGGAYTPAFSAWVSASDLARFITAVAGKYAPGMSAIRSKVWSDSSNHRCWFWPLYPPTLTLTGSPELRFTGVTTGFRSSIVIDPQRRRGIATLTNTNFTPTSTAALALFRDEPLTDRMEQFTVVNGENELFIPIFTNYPHETPDAEVVHAVIMIHGTDNTTFAGLYNAAKTATSSAPGVMVIAPQFAELQYGPVTDQLYWGGDWRFGGQSSDDLAFQISNFEVLDLLIEHLFDTFENLASVVVAGFSAGGQCVNRYAATQTDPRISYAIGAPSSFVWFSTDRPDGEGGWETPTGCPTYNDYPYGMDDLSDTPYMAAIGATALAERYEANVITYLVGENDTNPTEVGLDLTCPATVQGAGRRERMENYHDYLDHHFGGDVHTRHTLEIVSDAGHQGATVFGGAQGTTALLAGYGES